MTEHFKIPIQEIEFIVGSLSNTLGGTGGFAIGDTMGCNYMRLNCTGYVFSASLPPYISTACMAAIDLVKEGTELTKLRKNIEYFHEKFKDVDYLTTTSNPLSPLIHLRLKPGDGNNISEQMILSEIIDKAFHKHQVVFCHTRYLEREKFSPSPSIKIGLSSKHTQEDIDLMIKSLIIV